MEFTLTGLQNFCTAHNIKPQQVEKDGLLAWKIFNYSGDYQRMRRLEYKPRTECIIEEHYIYSYIKKDYLQIGETTHPEGSNFITFRF